MKKLTLFGSVAAGSILLAGVAHAQDATPTADPAANQAEEVSSVDDIVVTARKREERIQDVPISITAFSGEALERMGVQGFNDLALSNPNVKIAPIQGQSVVGSSVTIRGNVQSASTLQVDPSVGVYVDGHIIAHTVASAGLTVDVASVQTLKGPQGTLFGRNTTGGALLIQTVDPELGVTTGYLQGELGDVDVQRFGGAITVPLGDRAAMRLAYQNNHRGTYQTLSTGQKLGFKDEEVLRFKLLFEPTASTRVFFTAESVDESGSNTAAILSQPNNPVYDNVPVVLPGGALLVDPRTNGEPSSGEAQFYTAGITQDVGPGQLKFLAGYRRYSTASSFTTASLGYTSQDKPDDHDVSFEIQYNANLFNGFMDLTSGLYYFEETIHESQNSFLYTGVQRASRYLTATSESQSAYVQATMHVIPRVNLTLGGRYTMDEKTGVLFAATRSGTAEGTTAAAAANATASLEQSFEKFNYLATVDYAPMEDVLLYASTSTGYRAGGAGIDRVSEAPTNPNFRITTSFAPESITNYEAGFKTRFLDRRITLNGAAFYQDYKDYQFSVIVNTFRVTQNVDAVIQGFELDGTARLFDDTTVNLSAGYIDATVNSAGAPQDGATLPLTTKWTWSASINQGFTIGNGYLDLVASYSWRDAFSSTIATTANPRDEEAASRIEPLGLVNLSATYVVGPYTLAAYINNATDEKSYGYYTESPPTILFGSLGLPRLMGVRLKYAF